MDQKFCFHLLSAMRSAYLNYITIPLYDRSAYNKNEIASQLTKNHPHKQVDVLYRILRPESFVTQIRWIRTQFWSHPAAKRAEKATRQAIQKTALRNTGSWQSSFRLWVCCLRIM